MLLTNGLSTFFITDNPVFSNVHEGLLKNPPDLPVLCNWVFDNFILGEELFAKALLCIETCLLLNNNLCGKLVSSLESPTTFDESFKVISVPIYRFQFTNLRVRQFYVWSIIISHFILILY